MTRVIAETAVRDILAAIDAHEWRDVLVPDGFAIEDVSVEEKRNPFAPDALRHWRVTATLNVPVFYSPDSSSGSSREPLPADRDNVDALRDWIIAEAQRAPVRRAKLRKWQVTQEDRPTPYLQTGEPDGPPDDWTVTAVIDIH